MHACTRARSGQSLHTCDVSAGVRIVELTKRAPAQIYPRVARPRPFVMHLAVSNQIKRANRAILKPIPSSLLRLDCPDHKVCLAARADSGLRGAAATLLVCVTSTPAFGPEIKNDREPNLSNQHEYRTEAHAAHRSCRQKLTEYNRAALASQRSISQTTHIIHFNKFQT
jgi:hypothetical protein